MKVIERIIFQVKQQGAILGNQLNYNTYINRFKFQDVPSQIRFKVEKVNIVLLHLNNRVNWLRLKWLSFCVNRFTSDGCLFNCQSFYY